MIKFGGLIDDSKKIHGTKYILSAAPDNTVALDGAELIPVSKKIIHKNRIKQWVAHFRLIWVAD